MQGMIARYFFAICIIIGAIITPAFAEKKLKVVTTFTIIADIAANVGGTHTEIVSILRPNAEAHNYNATPRDILKAQDADLILWNGLGLELWFRRFFNNLRGDVPSVVVSAGVVPIPIGEGQYQGKPNPHAWMSPKDVLIYIDNIAAAFARYDRKNAAHYRQNAEDYKAKIQARLSPFYKKLQAIPDSRRWLVTSEGAFSYLARDLGLRELYLWPINGEQQNTITPQLLKVIKTVRRHSIPVIFSESTISPDLAMQVARETNADYGGVLYVDSLSAEDGPVPTYLDLITTTIQTVIEGIHSAG